jgi:hypothetical protein
MIGEPPEWTLWVSVGLLAVAGIEALAGTSYFVNTQAIDLS